MRRDLIEAYLGRYEEEYMRGYRDYVQREAELQTATGAEVLAVQNYDAWVSHVVEQEIEDDTPMERLAEYLEWNGIIGYLSPIFAIANGES